MKMDSVVTEVEVWTSCPWDAQLTPSIDSLLIVFSAWTCACWATLGNGSCKEKNTKVIHYTYTSFVLISLLKAVFSLKIQFLIHCLFRLNKFMLSTGSCIVQHKVYSQVILLATHSEQCFHWIKSYKPKVWYLLQFWN